MNLLRCALTAAASVAALTAQTECSAEVKFRLKPTQAKEAAKALKDDKPKEGKVMLYDTPSLALLNQGVILRVRSGNEEDLTVKLRPKSSEGLAGLASCEADIASDGSVQHSFGAKREPFTTPAPKDGLGFQAELDASQKKLLLAAKPEIVWKNVQRFPAVKVEEWSSKKEKGFDKITVEQWKWDGGEILEISTKTDEKSASGMEAKLKAWVEKHRLKFDADTRGKVATFLKSAAGS